MKRLSIAFLAAAMLLALLPATALAAPQSDMLVYATEPVFMRTGPGAEHSKMVELQTGEGVIFQGLSGKWAKVRRDGAEGYVFAQYLTDPAHVLGRLYTAKSGVSVYAGDSTKSKHLGKLKKGAMVVEYSAAGAWSRVYWEDGFGYVRSKYLKRISAPVQGYGTGMAAMEKLEKANGFSKTNQAVFIEYYLDANQNLAIRVSSGADRAKLEKEVADILGADTPCYITLSSLPKAYNAAKIAKVIEEIGSKVEKLTPAQRELLPLSSWGYSPLEDCFRVGMVVCDEPTIANFKAWVGDIPNTVFVQEEIAKPAV